MRFTPLCWLLVVGGLLLAATVQAQTKPAQRSLAALLKASRWQKRVLLLCAPTATDAALLRQRQLLAPARPDLDARDLLVHEVLLDNLSVADKKYVTETLRTSGTGFTVLLIGKDGGVKRRETEPVTPGSLFKTIDVMPMRQQEMRKN
ncbi:DUF4174 domain-containing protein [Hymenobacter sp. BT186]|uniref:DUF4174 domain-containing protein n=1 Tax=Hymenobacter telluris TaxID=2816474 RepID=A0A939JDC4_9BACT|nr:DUF4174 domain-containing protein [Hymenobacter telluris]MBO0359260.1 DUF4174 domain-containing protein [Hymenobacter telluris]MBW3375286.1 DUF4174 domain-containing protein [Hymenobacter norwichensis]